MQQHWREHKACGDQQYQACVQRVRNRCVWLYFRFSLSYRDVEEMMAEQGIAVSYETIRQWCRIYREPNQGNADVPAPDVIIIDRVQRLQLQEDFPPETVRTLVY